MLNYSKAGANKTLIRDHTDQVFNEHGGRRRPRARVVRSPDRDTIAFGAAGP
ncbi:MAG: hypothetical protein QOF27_677 [Gaiellaceae bacterium]|nr:hypothetical protein [Gaiellaceae bacterium]